MNQNQNEPKPTSDEQPSDQGLSVQRLVLCLFEARKVSKLARKVWAEKSAEVGDCPHKAYQEGPCYNQRNPKLCDVCAAKQPFWEARQKASTDAGAALRRVLNAGKFLSENA